MNIVSLFSGCGGLDLGFSQAGFNVVWANEYDRTIHDTYLFNHTQTLLDKRDIKKIPSSDIPDCDGVIGGSPCISWSVAGKGKGIEDPRGQLFWEFIRVVKDKQPKFFLAENVKGILGLKHKEAFDFIISKYENVGYRVSYKLLNAKDYSVPQDRQRVIVVGIRIDIGKEYEFPEPSSNLLTLRDAISNIDKNVSNQEYSEETFSSMYMSRNRVRCWDEPSFTILASCRQIPLHPQSSKMIKSGDSFIFDPNSTLPYRRLSVRECARIQTFPDDFVFLYQKVRNGYKMVGNAVPVNFAECLAKSIVKCFS